MVKELATGFYVWAWILDTQAFGNDAQEAKDDTKNGTFTVIYNRLTMTQ